jgi:Ca2+-binding RTX toxin-like protein
MAITRFGGEISVNLTTAGMQEELDVVGLKGGGFVVVWEDDSQQSADTSQEAARAQIFSASGAKVGPEILANQSLMQDQQEPAVAAPADGGFFAVWSDEPNTPASPSGMGRFFSANGAATSSEALLTPGFQTSSGANLQSELSVASLAGGSYVVVWQCFTAGQGTDIWFQRLGSAGQMLGQAQLVNGAATAAFEIGPDVTGLAGGGYVVAWETPGDIRLSVYNANGGLVRGDVLANTTTTGTQKDVSLAQLTNGGFVAVWSDAGECRGQVFDATGLKVGGEFLVNTVIDGTQRDPDVVGLPNGGFAVVWEDGSIDPDIMLQVFSQQGVKVGSAFRVNEATTDDQTAPVVTLLEGGRLAVAWEARVDSGSGQTVLKDIRAQIVDIFGGTIAGDAEANTIVGSDAGERLNGGEGNDTLTGGPGPDTFVFDAAVKSKTIAAANADLITDFDPAEDTIELAATQFTKLKLGILKNKAFDSGKKKPAKDKHLVYFQEKTGELWYDANGKKQKGKGDVLVATLDKGLDLTASDIVVA